MAIDENVEFEKMLAGQSFVYGGERFHATERRAAKWRKKFNQNPWPRLFPPTKLLRKAFLHFGNSQVYAPQYWSFGHVHIGERVFINSDCMFIDNAKITISDGAMIGPRVQFITINHPVAHADRYLNAPTDQKNGAAIMQSGQIHIGENVWVGAGAIILPGVTIGARSVIGAGSVVTKSMPEDVVAFGNPCRVQRAV